MSVMNGFRTNLTERLIGVNSHLNLYSFNEKIKDDEIETIKKQLDTKSYQKIFSSIEKQGLVISDNISKGVIMRSYKEISSEHYLYERIITKKLSSMHRRNKRQLRRLGKYPTNA